MRQKRRLVCCTFCGKDTWNASKLCNQHDCKKHDPSYLAEKEEEEENRTVQEEYNGETVRDDI